jgi:predicted RNase H-like nuclease
MRYIGIDLAWKMSPGPEEKRTAVTCLDDGARLIFYKQCRTDEEIIESLDRLCNVGCVIGVDAPLVVPPDTEGRRVCEGLLADMQIRVMPTDPRRFERWYGGCRGVVLLEKLQARDHGYVLADRLPSTTGKAVVEVYPAGSWKRLFGDVPKFKGVPVEEKRQAILRLKNLLRSGMPPRYPAVGMDVLDKTKTDLDGLSGPGLDVFGDALDAVMAAYTVMLWDRSSALCEVVGDLKGGFILMPKSPRAR